LASPALLGLAASLEPCCQGLPGRNCSGNTFKGRNCGMETTEGRIAAAECVSFLDLLLGRWKERGAFIVMFWRC